MDIPSKNFRKRNAILNFLRASKEHPSAETVYEALKPEIPDLSLGTVYRNLALFKKQGVIASVGCVNGIERYDGNVTPHVHFVCNCCGRVLDLHAVSLPSSVIDAAGRWGDVAGYQLVFTGKCEACRCENVSAG